MTQIRPTLQWRGIAACLLGMLLVSTAAFADPTGAAEGALPRINAALRSRLACLAQGDWIRFAALETFTCVTIRTTIRIPTTLVIVSKSESRLIPPSSLRDRTGLPKN